MMVCNLFWFQHDPSTFVNVPTDCCNLFTPKGRQQQKQLKKSEEECRVTWNELMFRLSPQNVGIDLWHIIQVAKTHPGRSIGWRTNFFTSTFMSMRVLIAALITICKCCRKIQSNHSQKTLWPFHPYLGQKLTAKLEKEWLAKWSRSSAFPLLTLLVFDACCRLC